MVYIYIQPGPVFLGIIEFPSTYISLDISLSSRVTFCFAREKVASESFMYALSYIDVCTLTQVRVHTPFFHAFSDIFLRTIFGQFSFRGEGMKK